MASKATDLVPTWAEFQNWNAQKLRPFISDQTVVFAPGGTSRWYFLEYGDPSAGYGEAEAFRDYGHRAVSRIAEIASMMYEDGIRTVFVVGFAGGQAERNIEYRENLSWAYEILVDEISQEIYDRHDLGVMFRGGWERLFDRLGAEGSSLIKRFDTIEQQTALDRDRWLIWCVQDDLIPRRLLATVLSSLQQTGQLPEPSTLRRDYYGRPLEGADIFIAPNKPSVAGMCPPMLTLSDLYFTVSPSLYMDHSVWRRILYDHLFARRSHYRDYTRLAPDAMDDMRGFYQANEDAVLGIGVFHDPTQTWRPMLWPNLQPDVPIQRDKPQQ